MVLSYAEPLYPVGSVVLVAEPTHYFHCETKNVIGTVYEAYIHKGFKMYAVLFKKCPDCFDMKFVKPSTERLTEELCCQHHDEHRLSPINFRLTTANDCRALPLLHAVTD